jgi:uncharacterized protein (TIGR03086 family)
MSDDIDLLSGALREAEAAVLAIEPAQRALPTASPGVDVGALVDHLVGWARSFAARLSGHDDEVDPGSYRAGDEPAAELHEAARTIVAAYREGGPAAQQLPVGMLIGEFTVHGWELSRAIGREPAVDPAAAEAALATLHGMLKPEYRGEGKAFGAEVPVDASASALDRLVGFSGRDPGWRPPAPAA